MASIPKPRSRRLTIGELARQAGLSVETIRFYEHEGLVEKPARPLGSIRTYPQRAVQRLAFVHEAKVIGFTLREIRTLLALSDDPQTDAAAVRGRAMAKLAQVEAKFAQLGRMRATLRDLLSRCPGRGELEGCPIVQALSVTKAAELRTEPFHSSKGKHEMKSVDLTIEGMHCEGCAKTVEALLKSEPGVKAATISYAKGIARVMFDPASVDLSTLVRAVERAGYRVPESR